MSPSVRLLDEVSCWDVLAHFVGNCFVSINTLKAQQGQSGNHAWFYNSTQNGAVVKNKQHKSL